MKTINEILSQVEMTAEDLAVVLNTSASAVYIAKCRAQKASSFDAIPPWEKRGRKVIWHTAVVKKWQERKAAASMKKLEVGGKRSQS